MSWRRSALPVVALVGLAVVVGCGGKTATAPQRSWGNVMAKNTADTLWLAMHLDPLHARVGQAVTATVSLTNLASAPYRNTAGAAAMYEVQVSDSQGRVVYNSLPATPPTHARSFHVSGDVRTTYHFSLSSPGTYFVVACTTNSPQLVTRTVPIVVSVQ